MKKAQKIRSAYTIGIDLGGTKVAFAAVDPRGKVLAYHREPSDKSSPRQLCQQLARNIIDIEQAAGKRARGIGLASAGPLDTLRGELIYPSNFPGWKRVPLKRLLERELRKAGSRHKISVQNDAMAAALGEGWVGGAKGCDTYAVITVGTGIGSGIIFAGKPLQFRGMGGEWGVGLFSAALNVTNKKTTFESIASGTGIFAHAQALGFKGKSTEELVAKIRRGDKKYKVLFNAAAEALAALSFNLSLGLHPERILFTGGLMEVSDLFFPQTLSLYQRWISERPGFRTKLAKARLGGKAGVLGAAKLPYA